ncbi:hypothetical protein CYMTET_43693 [Cymbomonas tetramitiformis]|uniref:Uncharacterized protein n=1 Tax=Cymbomonas tetramitiformis TaxID=36881 RepID=A0AAE0F0D7_9CHLO|nr:hypothetical protein CYMTET_43693 [Cymbomonas tetramitiformis]
MVVYEGHKDVVELLLARGANGTLAGRTPLHTAPTGEVAEMLRDAMNELHPRQLQAADAAAAALVGEVDGG